MYYNTASIVEYISFYAWEQRKLKDLAEFNPKSTLPYEFEYVDLESVVGTDLVSHRTELKESSPSRAQRLAQRGDVFYQTVRPYQKNNYLYDLPYNNYVFSTGYAQMRPSIDSYFLFSHIQEEQFVKDVLDRSTGTSYPAINSNDLAEIEINVPVNSGEQEKVGSFFRTLDDTIALHKGQLDKLKLLKKGCLQQMFPQNGEKVPRIRFADFDGEWGQRKLGEVATFAKGKGYSKNNLIEYGYKIILYGKLYTNYETVIETIDTYVESDENAIRSHVGDVIVPASGETAEDIARASVVPYNGIILGGDLNIIETNKDVLDPNFLALSLSYGIAHKELSKYAQGKSVVHLHGADLKRTTISFPNLDEQKQIGNFFKQLDITITLYHKKLNELTAIKKVCLEKFFI